MRIFPEGTIFHSFFLAKEGETLVIRRMVTLPDGTRVAPRYPIKAYKHLTSKEELEQFVNRLNYRDEAAEKSKKAIEIKLSFIPQKYLEDFREHLKASIPNEKDFKYLYGTLHSTFLDFFVNKMQLHDPLLWHENQTKWGLALLNKLEHDEKHLNILTPEQIYSAKSIKHFVQVANRFMEFIHHKNPREIPFVKFQPISKARLLEFEAQRKLNDDKTHLGLYISEKDWKLVTKRAPIEILPFLQLMYGLGLRREECLGLLIEDVRKGHVRLQRSIKTISLDGTVTYKPLKNRLKRNIPYWFCSADDVYHWIGYAQNNKMHPDTLSTKWDELMSILGLSYKPHDPRRTFVTRALDLYPPNQVRQAVGHASLSTTMRYVRDKQETLDDLFLPVTNVRRIR